MRKHSDSWSIEEKKYLEAFFKLCPSAEKARKIVLKCYDMMKQKEPKLLDSWIEDALMSNI